MNEKTKKNSDVGVDFTLRVYQKADLINTEYDYQFEFAPYGDNNQAVDLIKAERYYQVNDTTKYMGCYIDNEPELCDILLDEIYISQHTRQLIYQWFENPKIKMLF